jgi:hypothetical protein
MSKKFLVAALASLVLTLTWTAVAQTSASSQTSVSGSSQSSVSADQNGAQVNAGSAGNVSQSTGLSHNDEPNKEKSKGTQSSTSAASSTTSSASANANRGSATGSASLANGTTLNAVLTKPVDARHARPGDEVGAKVTQDVKSDGKVVIPKNSRLVGHVTEAKAKSEGSAQSSLGIVFDHATLKNGNEVPVHAVIQALASAQSTAAANAAMEPMSAPMGGSGSGRSGGGLVGGVGSTVGATAGAGTGVAGNLGHTSGGVVNTSTNVAGSAAGNVGGLNAAGQLTSRSTGVIGMSGLQLASQATNSTQGSIVTSTSKTVKLDSGTQMLLRVAGE